MKILILGGYGNFGTRLALALAGDPAIELLIGGRDIHKARALAISLNQGGPAHDSVQTRVHPPAQALAIDVTHSQFAEQLQLAGAKLVLHTAGPFQEQGYQVALACAKAQAHYIDLADGRRFVCDFKAHLDAPFRQAQCLAITGASTVPALSSAIIDDLTRGWQQIDSIDCCIGPAQSAPRGVATMAAVLSYCGAPIQVWHEGQWRTEFGWAEPTPVQFARLRPRIGALCDIPDLELFPSRYAGVRTVRFRAALELRMSQYVFAALAVLRQRGWLKHPERLAGFLHQSARIVDGFGSALGGMVLTVTGRDHAGNAASRAWHIAADNDHGPEIPCMAATLLARKLARGQIDAIGADSAAGWLQLDEFTPEFAKWGMLTDVV